MKVLTVALAFKKLGGYMVATVNISQNIDTVMRGFLDIQKDKIPRAVASSLNKTLANIVTQTVRDLSAITGIKQKDVRDKLMRLKADRLNQEAILMITGRAMNLIRFGARQTNAGVSAAPWALRRVFPHTFIGNTGRTVFVRTGKQRLPIRPVSGPSIPREFVRDKFLKNIKTLAAERFNINFTRDLRYFTATPQGTR